MILGEKPTAKIHFSVPRGVGPEPQEGFDKYKEMSLVPRIGDNVSIDDYLYRVHVVDWHPWGEEGDSVPFVYIVLR